VGSRNHDSLDPVRWRDAVSKYLKGCCWHIFTGAIHMVLQDGQIVEQCCKCHATRVVHRDHR